MTQDAGAVKVVVKGPRLVRLTVLKLVAVGILKAWSVDSLSADDRDQRGDTAGTGVGVVFEYQEDSWCSWPNAWFTGAGGRGQEMR